MALDQPAAFDISSKFKPLSLAFDEAADLIEQALKAETFIPASFKTFTTHIVIVVDVTALCGSLKLIKEPPSLYLSYFVFSGYRLIYLITHRDLSVYLLNSKGCWWKSGLVVFKRDAM